MAKRIGGSRRKSRSKMTKKVSEKGKIKISRYFQEFKKGDRVTVKIEPSIHKGLPDPVFQGRVGEVLEKRGYCYVLKVMDGSVEKKLMVHPIHLLPHKR